MTLNSFIHLGNKNLLMPFPSSEINLPMLTEYVINGHIRIPEFQRPIIWNAEDVENLLDSVTQGYPIGFLLFWESHESLRERTPHPLHLKLRKIRKNEDKFWLLDGQQRVTALIGSFTDNLYLGRLGKTKYRAFYDLEMRKFKVLKVSEIEKKKPKPEYKIENWFIPLNKLFIQNRKGEFELDKNSHLQITPDLEESLGQRHRSDLLHLWKMFMDVKIPVINERKNLPDACTIFERLNTAGTPLTVVDVMIAKTYEKDFVLRRKIDELNEELASALYELKDTTVLQCMSACLAKDTETDSILANAKEIKNNWDETTVAIKSATSFLKNKTGVCLISKLLPHEILLAPLSYFFYKYATLKDKPKNDVEINNALKRFFWYNIFSENYGRSQSTKARDDMNEMDSLLVGNYSVFKSDKYDFSPFNAKDIKEEEISSSPFSKTFLCFLISKMPLNYNDNSRVEIERAINPQSIKSIHHVFPKTVFLEKLIDSIANVSIISVQLNNDIRNQRPSSYFAKFGAKNKELKETLKKHHLIGDFAEFGITDDKFDTFIEKRATLIEEEIKKLIEELKPVTPKRS